MIDRGIVHGSKNTAIPLIVGKSKVYVHTDITSQEIKDEDTGEIRIDYSYHSYEYDKDEYIYNMSIKQQSDIDYIAMMTEVDLDD